MQGKAQRGLTEAGRVGILNAVHFERGDGLNTVVTSKEAILATCRELVHTLGWAAVNIRSVAQACQISTGSIYNYFNSKPDLIAAAVESVWQDIFHDANWPEVFGSFTDCVQWVFRQMEQGEKKYPGVFTLHSIWFVEEEKSSARRRMAESWQHIQSGLLLALQQDQRVRPEAFDAAFTQEKFVEIVFSLIMAALLQHDYNCDGVLGMIDRVLY